MRSAVANTGHIIRSRHPPHLSPLSGVPQGATQNTLVATYNDLANVEELIKGGDIAAVILEPIVGNSGFIQPTQEFLQGCRDLATKYGTLLVFDEVMTGFRVAYGGAQVCRKLSCRSEA